jgi:hypothetical protein
MLVFDIRSLWYCSDAAITTRNQKRHENAARAYHGNVTEFFRREFV